MGKIIQTIYNPETQKLERMDRKLKEVFNNKRVFTIKEAFDIVEEEGIFYVPVEAYENGFEEQGVYQLEISLPTFQQAMEIKEGSIVQL